MVKVCVVGCLHGELDKVYADISSIDSEQGTKTQLVLCCGDFQSLRNPADLHSMSVPPKFYSMGDFYRYYAEEIVAPIPTVFVGGNHEASCYLQELPYGGWAAPNIWYMGYAGVVQFAGLRIAGISGIYKQHDYPMGHFEHPPYTEATKRSVYHLRSLEVFRLGQVARRVDIVLSHDWPRGIYHYGNVRELLQRKRHFREEVNSNTLGSPPNEQLLCRLRPRYWFSAHLHCKFPAIVAHSDTQREFTKFLALDKCLPSRDYLQFLDIEPDPSFASYTLDGQVCSPSPDAPLIVSWPQIPSSESTSSNSPVVCDTLGNLEPPCLCLDPEWLCVLRATNDLMSLSQIPCMLPGQDGRPISRSYQTSIKDLESLWEPFAGTFSIPENFERTAPVYKPADANLLTIGSTPRTDNQRATASTLARLAEEGSKRQQIFSNPQTELLCAMLELVNPNAMLLGRESYNLADLATRMSSNVDSPRIREPREEDHNPHAEDDKDSITSDRDVANESASFIASPDALFVSTINAANEVVEEYDPCDPSPLKQVRSDGPVVITNDPLTPTCGNPEVINLDELVDDDEEEDVEEESEVLDKGYNPMPIESIGVAFLTDRESENAYKP